MADDYERTFMPGDGEVLHRHKATIPRWTIGLAAGLPAGAGALAGVILFALSLISVLPALAILGGAAIYAALMTALMVLTGVARLSVSEGELQVQMGMSHLDVPIDEITSIEIGESGTRAKGIGLRLLLDGTRVYNLMGDANKAVRIRRAGESHDMVFVCREPDAVLAAVQEARTRTPVKVRVAAPEEAEHEVEITAGAKEKKLR